MLLLARLVRLATTVAVVLIAAGILLWVLSANRHNLAVSDVHRAGRWLVGPFHNVFQLKNGKVNLAVNWGLALVIYAIVGGFLARLLARPLPRRLGFGRMRKLA